METEGKRPRCVLAGTYSFQAQWYVPGPVPASCPRVPVYWSTRAKYSLPVPYLPYLLVLRPLHALLPLTLVDGRETCPRIWGRTQRASQRFKYWPSATVYPVPGCPGDLCKTSTHFKTLLTSPGCNGIVIFFIISDSLLVVTRANPNLKPPLTSLFNPLIILYVST